MAKDDTSKTPAGVTSSPIGNERISVTENSGALLKDEHYLSWSQSATFWLKSLSKFGYVDGTIKVPS